VNDNDRRTGLSCQKDRFGLVQQAKVAPCEIGDVGRQFHLATSLNHLFRHDIMRSLRDGNIYFALIDIGALK
jgi:hypothetical protein